MRHSLLGLTCQNQRVGKFGMHLGQVGPELEHLIKGLPGAAKRRSFVVRQPEEVPDIRTVSMLVHQLFQYLDRSGIVSLIVELKRVIVPRWREFLGAHSSNRD